MARSCVADTSWLVALVNADDDFHSVAQREASQMERVHVPPVILAETLSLLHGPAKTAAQKRESIEKTRKVVRLLSAKPNMSLSSPGHDHEATMQYWENHPGLSYHDAAAVAAAARLGLELCSFDEAQKAALPAGKP